MKNQMRKWMAMLLAVVMLMSSVPFTAFAEETGTPAVETVAEPEKKPEAAEEEPKAEENAAEEPADKRAESETEVESEEASVEVFSEDPKEDEVNAASMDAEPAEEPAQDAANDASTETEEDTVLSFDEKESDEDASATEAPAAAPVVTPTSEAKETEVPEATEEAAAEPSVAPSEVPSVEPTVEPTAEPSVEPTPDPSASASPEASATPEVTPEATAVPTVEFTAPEDGDVVPGLENLKVEWEVEGSAEGLLFSARDLQRDLKEEDSFIYKEAISGKKYEISGSDLPYDTDFELWIAVTDASGNVVSEDKIEIHTDSEPEAEETVEPEMTETPEVDDGSSNEITIEEEMPVAEDVPLLTRAFGLRTAAITGTLENPVVTVAGLGEDNTYPVYTDLDVSWEAVENAEVYRIICSTFDGYYETTNTSWRIYADELSVVGEATITVMAMAEGWTSGSTSVGFTLVAAEEKLSAPANLKVDDDYVLTWDAVEGAEYYVVSVENDDWEFRCTTEECTLDLAEFSYREGGSYSATVEAVASGKENEVASISVAIPESLVPQAAVLNYETPHMINEDLVITWNAVEGAESYFARLMDPNGETVYLESPSSDTLALTIPGSCFTVSGSYYLIFAVNHANVEAYTNGYITVVDGVLSTPTNLSLDENFVLTWDAVEGAEEYEVCIEGMNDCYSCSDCSFELISILESSGTYKVTVQAYAEGKASEKATLTFEVSEEHIPAKPVIYIPSSHAVGTPLTVTWDAMENVEEYYVRVEYTQNENVYYGDGIYDGSATSCDIPASIFAQPGSYMVQLEVGNSYGGENRTTEYLTVVGNDGEVLAAPQIHDVVGVLDGGCSITWDPVEGAEEYLVTVTLPDWTDVGTTSGTSHSVVGYMVDQLGTGSVTVTAVAEGRTSSSATKTFEIVEMGKVENLTITDDYILNWDAVPGAERYYISWGDTYEDYAYSDTNEYKLYMYNYEEGKDYTLSVSAEFSGSERSEAASLNFTYKELGLKVPAEHATNTDLEITWNDAGYMGGNLNLNLYYGEESVWSYHGWKGSGLSEILAVTIEGDSFQQPGEYRFEMYAGTPNNDYWYVNRSVTFTVTAANGQLAAPVIHDIDVVLDDYYLITWDPVPNATAYLVDYVNPDGDGNYWPDETAEPQYYYSCSQVGDASITVTATAPGYTSSSTTKEFTVRALGTLEAPLVKIAELSAENTVQVSTDLTITWDTIENADEYDVSLKSEDSSWSTTAWDAEAIIEAQYLDQPGEYVLTVTAEKDGWIPGETMITFTVVSDAEALPVPTNIALDENYCLTWDAVPGAEIYYILFEGLQGETTETAYDLKEHIDFSWITAGDYTLTLTAAAEGVPSSEATFEFTISDEDTLGAPTNIVLDEDFNLTWDAVEGAESYTICIDGETDTTEDTEFYLPNNFGFKWLDAGTHTLTLTATADGVPSAEVDFEFTVTDDMIPDIPEFIDLPDIHGAGENLTIQWTDCENVAYCWVDFDYSDDDYDETWTGDVEDASETTFVIPGSVFSRTGEGRVILWVESEFGIWRYTEGYFDICEILETLDAPVIHDISEVRVNTSYTFTWDAVENAENYYVEVNVPYDENVYAEYKFDELLEDTSFTITLGPDDLPGAASITVSACAEGYASGSSTVEFEVLPVYGTLDAPIITLDNANEANEIYFGRNLNISWLTVENAEKYDLDLDQANGNNVTGTYTKETAATIDQGNLLILGEYVLTIKAQAPGWLDGVTTVTFTVVECPPLDAPVIEDIGDVYIGDDLTIRWSAVENAEEYELDKYCWDDEDGWCLVVTSSTSTTTDTEMTFYGYTLGYDPGKWRVQVTAIAEDYQEGVSEYVYFNLLEKFTYEIVDGEAIITGYLPDDEPVFVPGTLGGYPVTAIGDGAFEGNKNITSVYLSDSVTSIGDAAFKNCTALKSVTGYGVTSIGDEAFAGCTSLTSIDLGDVNDVGENAFSGVNEDLFHWEISVDTSGATVSGYEGNWKIFTLEIGEGITTIAEKAFKNCINIQETYLPTSLQRIESQAFAGCTSVNKVRLYEDCTYIADDAFSGDEAVTFILYQRDVNAMSYARQYALDHNIPCTVLQWPTELETPVVEWESKDYTVYKHVPVTIKVYAANSDQVRMFMNGQNVGAYDVDANGNTSFSYTFTEEGRFDVYFRSEKDGEQISTPINTVTVLSQSISFTAPLNEAEIPMAELTAAWTEVYGADHYEFSARYLDEEEPFIFHQKADTSGVTVPAEQIIGGRELQLWVGAYNVAGTLICAETIQVKVKHTISFIAPRQGDTVDGEKALVLQWTEVYGADHYEYSARYTHQDSAFISNRDVNKATSQTIPVTQMLGEKKLQLWVGAFDANDELICAETIQVNTSAVQELTISFTEPADEAILAYDEAIAVGWTEVWLADHYRLSAKYENETEDVFSQKFARDIFTANLSSSILEKDKTLILTIAACDEFDKILREETVQQSIKVFLAEEAKETIGFVSPTKGAEVPYTEDLQVSWTEVESADHYMLYAAYEDTADEYVYEQEFTDERTGSIAMNLLKPGKNMQLTVKAYDAEGGVIAEKTITVSIQDIPPLDPIYLNVEQGQVLAEANDRFAFEWNEVDGADHYLFSLRDITDSSTEGELLYNQERIEVGAGNRFIASLTGGRRYRAWVCAVAPGKQYNDAQSSKFQVEFVYKIVPEFQVTGLEGSGKLNEGGTLSWTAPVAGNGDVITPDNYIIHIYFKENGTPVHSIEVDGAATSTVIDGSVFNQYGYYRIAVYATMYESWNGGYHSSADLDPHYTVGSPKVTASGILDGNTHVRNNVTRYTGTYTFWAAANDATEKVYAKRGSTVLNNGNSMTQDGTYGEDRRFILKNVSVPEGINLYTFYTANGSQNQIKIYGVNKYTTPQIKYANQDDVKVSAVPGGAAIGSLPINAEVVAHGELDVSSSEGYEYVLYEGSYYYVDKDYLGAEEVSFGDERILTPTGDKPIALYAGEDIDITWTSCVGADYYKVYIVDLLRTRGGKEPNVVFETIVSAKEELRVVVKLEDLLENEYFQPSYGKAEDILGVKVQAYAY